MVRASRQRSAIHIGTASGPSQASLSRAFARADRSERYYRGFDVADVLVWKNEFPPNTFSATVTQKAD